MILSARKMPTVVSRLGLILLAVAACCLPALAREYDVHPPVDPHHVDGSLLGGPVDLSSTWLVKQGDDPRYADPGLNDRGWLVIKSGPAFGSYGWKGVDRLWYRTHVRIPAGEHDLAVSLSWFLGSYQIYVNGVEVGSSGAFPPGGVNVTSSDRSYRIPDAALGSGELTIAIRASIGRVSENGMDAAGFTGITTLLLGPARLLADASSLWYFRDITSNITNIAFEVVVLLIALALALTLRSEREYLALVIYLAAVTAINALELWTNARNLAPSDPLILLHAILSPLRSIAGVEFVRLVLGLRRTRWFAAYEWLLGVFGLVVIFWLRHVINLGPHGLSHPAVIAANLVSEIVFLPADAGLPLLALWVWWRRRNPTALLIFVPLIISAAVDYIGFGHYILYQLHLATGMSFAEPPIEALHVGWDEITTFIFSGALLLFLVLRTLRIARDRARIASEVEAAQTVQQVLLARASQATPGFLVESVYYPAGEVGGDFFLVSPDAEDGSLIAIVGDVSGKGLIAAMRVSMILGVLRREDSRQPAVILARLNEALLTQGEMGFTTACCVRLELSGRYTLSNAGHISPYVNGIEIDTPPGLPLGLAPEQAYEPVTGELRKGEKLVLMSDGVVEARSAKGELYGFDRLPGLTRMPAADIADIAQRFGQEDDITVLTIACVA
jgi:sigma-B regulation protein RsbU (phosphoserine phosphatase)